MAGRSEEEHLTEQLNLRLAVDDMTRLDDLSGLVPRSIVARAALRIGIEAIEKDPSLLTKAARAPAGRRKADEK